ncbi:MAG: SRPBCC family protein [Solirubrobacteraceae bacterium]
MRFENRFAVDAPLERVWKAVLDVEGVAPMVPGAQVLEQIGDDAYKVAIKVRLGPMSMTYRGEIEVTERDDAAHRAVMRARAKEARGEGTADAEVTMALRDEDGRCAATLLTEVSVSGKAASMGQGVLQDVAGRLVDAFAGNLARQLQDGAGSPDVRTGDVAHPAAVPTQDGAGPPSPSTESPASSTPSPAPESLNLASLGASVVAARLRVPVIVAGLLALAAWAWNRLGRRSTR